MVPCTISNILLLHQGRYCMKTGRSSKTSFFYSVYINKKFAHLCIVFSKVIQSHCGCSKEPHRTLESPLDHCDPISNKQFEKAPPSGRASSLSCLCLLCLHW
ncbi:hypothetical protein AMECASPLE_027483 [Ameca splendens]|uniref:Uncharacterized protein n=1 Tax=Ameca splendens TaxID=208324 RepID=A0ABV0Y5E4_9TELE